MLKEKYRSHSPDDAKFLNRTWRGNVRRGSNRCSDNAGKARIKGVLHPVGSQGGRTISRLIRSFRPVEKKK